MAWNHDDVAPNRSRDELLGEVVRRGERLRRRRRVAAGLGGAAALLLVVAGVASVVGTGGEPATQLAVGRATTTVAHSLQPAAAGGTVLALEQPTTSVPASAAPATTIASQAVATTVAAADEPTPTVPPPPAAKVPCSAQQLEVTLTFAPTYGPGQPVVGQAVLRNVSGAPCYYFSYTQSQGFEDALGNPVAFGSAVVADAFAETPLAPGQTLTAAPQWDQKLCATDPACPPAPPGTYRGTVSWSFDGPPIQATAGFQIVP